MNKLSQIDHPPCLTAWSSSYLIIPKKIILIFLELIPMLLSTFKWQSIVVWLEISVSPPKLIKDDRFKVLCEEF